MITTDTDYGICGSKTDTAWSGTHTWIQETADDRQNLDIKTFIISCYADTLYIPVKAIKKIIDIEIPISTKCNYKKVTLTPRINIKQPVARSGFKRGQRSNKIKIK